MTHLGRNILVIGATVVGFLALHPRHADACGCFTPPDPSVPIVQAGERILFAMENGTVTAHIQIQYAGDAREFGWLLPLPSVPDLQLGTDELFNGLVNATQPKYRLVSKYEGNCGFNLTGRGFFGSSASGGAGPANADSSAGHSPLVVQDSIGPYDYAVLKADSKAEMLAWLGENHYFVPTGTDETVGAYIRPGAFFLALKLRSGQSAGDLQPVIVRYPSDHAMIPIVLTSVAAQPNMGVQVWMLGAGRAIPRNYHHTVINDLAIDWSTAGQNYNDVVIKAVAEAPQKHSFVTEYAGPSAIMQNILTYPDRFGTTAELAASPDAIKFVGYLQGHGFVFTSQLTAILARYIPLPPALAAQGIKPADFYASLEYYTVQYRIKDPAAFVGWQITFEPQLMAQEIEERVVKPAKDAGALFDKFPRLTRLYTTLSPEDMTVDPVFSFNASLPDVAKDHEANLTYHCGLGSQNPATTPATLVTEQGWTREFAAGTGGPAVLPPPPSGLRARRLEILSEDKSPQIVSDNPPTSGCACDAGGGAPQSAASVGGMLILAMAGMLGMRRRRPRRQS
jgi:MYXO-CTERM domain-containing protein